jgi:cell division protein ZapA
MKTQFNAKEEENASLKKENESLKNEYESLKKENESLKKENRSYRDIETSNRDDLVKIREINNNLQTENTNLREELKTSKTNADARINELEKKIKEVNRDKNHFSNLCGQKSKAVNDEKKKYQDALTELHSTDKDLKSLQNAYQDSQHQIADITTRSAKLKLIVDECLKVLKDSNHPSNKIQEQYNELYGSSRRY